MSRDYNSQNACDHQARPNRYTATTKKRCITPPPIPDAQTYSARAGEASGVYLDDHSYL